jgi:hypothetical protein
VTSIAISPGNRIVIVVGLEMIVAGTNDGVATGASAASRFFHQYSRGAATPCARANAAIEDPLRRHSPRIVRASSSVHASAGSGNRVRIQQASRGVKLRPHHATTRSRVRSGERTRIRSCWDSRTAGVRGAGTSVVPRAFLRPATAGHPSHSSAALSKISQKRARRSSKPESAAASP